MIESEFIPLIFIDFYLNDLVDFTSNPKFGFFSPNFPKSCPTMSKFRSFPFMEDYSLWEWIGYHAPFILNL